MDPAEEAVLNQSTATQCFTLNPVHWPVQNRIFEGIGPLSQSWFDVFDRLLLPVRWMACTRPLSRVEWVCLCVCVCAWRRIKSGYVAGREPGLVSAECCVCVCVCRLARKCGHGWSEAISQHGEAGKGYYAKRCIGVSVCACVWKSVLVCFCLYPYMRASGGLGRGFHSVHMTDSHQAIS